MQQYSIFFRNIFLFLLSKYKIILSVAILSSIIGFCIALKNDEKYTGIISFVLEDDKGAMPVSGAMGLASQFGIDIGGGGGSLFSGPNILELFKSRMILQKVLNEKKYSNGKTLMYAYLNFYNKPLLKKYLIAESPNLNNVDSKRIIDSIVSITYSQIVNNLLVVDQGDKKNSVYEIKIISKDEMFSKIFVETIVDIVSQFYIETKSKKARLNLEILQRQVDSVRTQLNSSFISAATSSDQIYNLNPALSIQRVPATKMQFNQQANAVILTELVKNLELAKINLRKETPLFQVIDQPIIPLQKIGKGRIKNTFLGFLFGLFVASIFFTAKIIIPDILKES